MRLVPALLLVACHHGSTGRPPAPIACAEGRVGKVTVDGGTAEDVPQLAVLEGTLDDEARTERITKVSAELLRARGYARAELSVERQSGRCGVQLVVHLRRGPRFTLSRIAFDTDDEFPAAARRAAIEDALGTVNAIGGAYVEDRLTRALAALRRRYQDAGWLDVAIDAPRPVYDEVHGEVALTIPIHAGPRFKLGTVIARGGRRSTRAAVIDALGLRGGEWYDGRAVREAIERARREVDERIELHLQLAPGGNAIDLEAVVGEPR